ncbi:hypothetical protein [Filomicrobium sp.]|uniref:hypothetical protein n=1 Tax=Filomicrobium sp. TaxID=2024831 RepID=UPI00258D210B|nr:hypothetical protein [Filomicrobium sp.]MCV0371856.1 hypothetical protein [Filomicrobium sp.]
MTNKSPFASWSEDYKASQARSTAQLLKGLGAKEHEAKRHLKEAIAYYESRQWVRDGIEAEQLDGLLNDLRQKADTAYTLTCQTSDYLNAILNSQRSHLAIGTAAARRDELMRATGPLPQEDTVEPTPLESFLQTSRAPKPRTRKRKMSM